MAGYGKLTRLPFLVSEELHNRLLDEESPREIVAWLNDSAEVRTVLDKHFKGNPVTEKNLSEYKGGDKYADWKKKREALERERAETEFAMGLASEAGLNLSDAGDAIITSRLISQMRGETETKEITALAEVFARMRAATVSRGSLAIRAKEVAGRERKLALAERQMEMNTVKAFMKWAQSKEAQAILTNGKPKAVQMDLLHDLMFGKNS